MDTANPKQLLPQDVAEQMSPAKQSRRLTILRTALDMKPSEIADAVGIERTYWTRFEKGRRPISDNVAALLCSRYGVTLDWLILGRWDTLSVRMAERLRDAEAVLLD